MKPLLVGESPSRTGDRYWEWPLSGAPARTLCQCAGWPPEGTGDHLRDWSWALYARFETVNVFERHAEAAPWRAPVARRQAEAIEARMRVDGRTTVVLLGRRVAAAFGLDGIAYHEWVERFAGRAVVIPHPSGRNLILNDPAAREAIGATLREAVSAS